MAIPPAGSKDAPSFKGEDVLLDTFLADFEALSVTANWDEKEKVKRVIGYIDKESREIWMNYTPYLLAVGTAPIAVGYDVWDEFTKRLLLDYPNAKKPRSYTRAELEKLVEQTAREKQTSLDELVKFARHFRKIADNLTRAGVLTDREARQLFLRGLHADLRAAVCCKLEITCPGTVSWEINHILEAAEFELQNEYEHQMLERTLAIRPISSVKIEEQHTTIPQPSSVEETLKMLHETVNKLVQQQNNPKAVYMRNGPPRGDGTLPDTRPCHFCFEVGHMVRFCPYSKEY